MIGRKAQTTPAKQTKKKQTKTTQAEKKQSENETTTEKGKEKEAQTERRSGQAVPIRFSASSHTRSFVSLSAELATCIPSNPEHKMFGPEGTLSPALARALAFSPSPSLSLFLSQSFSLSHTLAS